MACIKDNEVAREEMDVDMFNYLSNVKFNDRMFLILDNYRRSVEGE